MFMLIVSCILSIMSRHTIIYTPYIFIFQTYFGDLRKDRMAPEEMAVVLSLLTKCAIVFFRVICNLFCT